MKINLDNYRIQNQSGFHSCPPQNIKPDRGQSTVGPLLLFGTKLPDPPACRSRSVAIFEISQFQTSAIIRFLTHTGAPWFRRGRGRCVGHAEVQSPRKSAAKNINANNKRFALAA